MNTLSLQVCIQFKRSFDSLSQEG